MSADPPSADRARGRRRPRPRPQPEHRPTDDELAALVADVGRPVAQMLTALSGSAVALLRALVDESYERGRRAGLAEARAQVVLDRSGGQIDVPAGGPVTIRLSDPPSPALLADLAGAKRGPRMAVPR